MPKKLKIGLIFFPTSLKAFLRASWYSLVPYLNPNFSGVNKSLVNFPADLAVGVNNLVNTDTKFSLNLTALSEAKNSLKGFKTYFWNNW